MTDRPIPVVTCTVYYKNAFLVIRRHDKAKKFGGSWGFPGGKVEQGETIAGALIREIHEETHLVIKDEVYLADSYYYGDSLGLHFIAFATTNKVHCEPGVEHRWLKSLAELQTLPRIPGINFHILQAEYFVKNKIPPLSLEKIDYTPDKYIN